MYSNYATLSRLDLCTTFLINSNSTSCGSFYLCLAPPNFLFCFPPSSLALEWGPHNIRVNAISPGLFRTEMSDEMITTQTEEWYKKNCPVPRIGDTSKDLDGPILLLASEAGSYITGVHLIVDGGESLMLKFFE